MILKEIILPVLTQGETLCMLVDDFRDHIHNDEKEYVRSFKIESDDDEE